MNAPSILAITPIQAGSQRYIIRRKLIAFANYISISHSGTPIEKVGALK
ncbi:MAG: hypothetical protein KME38_02285 [Spirirestis rafaelensis WJT71-NPBG6]|jgi:hypothetical protein|nr:hypothetical protein [Spirirestis rafaelensis WJT71-NPBG6]